MTRILIVDDHPVIRQGVKGVLSEDPNIRVFGEARNAPEALQLIRRQHWDAVVLDINIPGRGGLDLLKEMKQAHPHLPVLVLSIYPEDQYAVRALKVGAAGYLTKESAPDELLNAVSKILKGGKYVSPSLAEKLASDLQVEAGGSSHKTLSDREYEVMRLIASGKSAKEIAKKLSLSDKTISTYRTRILEKMDMTTNAELTHYAIKNSLVD